jgi:hypothetical protein
VYQIPNYHNFYQSTIEDKENSTGVVLYVTKIFSASIMENLSYCTRDIESIFVEISQSSSPKTLTIGVIYRPPVGTLPHSFISRITGMNMTIRKLENYASIQQSINIYLLCIYLLRIKINSRL